MKGFVSKIKKLIFSIAVVIISFPSKIFAAIDPSAIQDLYGPPPTSTLYGVYRPSPVTIIWRIARTFVVPIALLIGIIIYFKKSKSSKKKKILVTLGIVVLVALLYFVINKIVINLNLL